MWIEYQNAESNSAARYAIRSESFLNGMFDFITAEHEFNVLVEPELLSDERLQVMSKYVCAF